MVIHTARPIAQSPRTDQISTIGQKGHAQPHCYKRCMAANRPESRPHRMGDIRMNQTSTARTTTGTTGKRVIGHTETARSVELSEYLSDWERKDAVANGRDITPATIVLPLIVITTYRGIVTWPGNGGGTPAHGYAVTVLGVNGEVLQTNYFEGTAHTGHADAADVVGALLSDAGDIMGYVELTHKDAPPNGKYVAPAKAWREWAQDMGAGDSVSAYDDARQNFRACLKTANRLLSMLGEETLASAISIAHHR